MALHPVDVFVGKKLRSRRTIMGMSQEELGEAVGVTFQQIQKYERGLNRVGSSRLYEFSMILNVDVSHFFEEYDASQNNETLALDKKINNTADIDSLNNKEVLTLVRAYYGIKNEDVRKKLLALIKSLSSFEELVDPLQTNEVRAKKLHNA